MVSADFKQHLAEKLVALLEETDETQASLAEFCGIHQGQVADHIRGRSYPKFQLLLRYWRFFKDRLERPFTLYELTGLELVRDFEHETQAGATADEAARKFWSAYQALPADDPRRRAIDTLLNIDSTS